jgi:hypothetical protein
MRRNEGDRGSLTESLVRTKLSTSIESVAPSLGLSSVFLPLAMLMEWVVLTDSVDD